MLGLIRSSEEILHISVDEIYGIFYTSGMLSAIECKEKKELFSLMCLGVYFRKMIHFQLVGRVEQIDG